MSGFTVLDRSLHQHQSLHRPLFLITSKYNTYFLTYFGLETILVQYCTVEQSRDRDLKTHGGLSELVQQNLHPARTLTQRLPFLSHFADALL